jgi:hypothetical protein
MCRMPDSGPGKGGRGGGGPGGRGQGMRATQNGLTNQPSPATKSR